MKWLIQYSEKSNGKSMGEKLADEVIAAAKEEGGRVQEERRYASNG